MTSVELYNKLTPNDQHKYLAYPHKNGLEYNSSDMFCRLIKDAGRCNGYNSDIYYDLKTIEDKMKSYNPEEGLDPIWIGFRKLGVDGTSFVLCRINDEKFYGSLSQNYFALYSVSVEEENDNYYVVLNEYYV